MPDSCCPALGWGEINLASYLLWFSAAGSSERGHPERKSPAECGVTSEAALSCMKSSLSSVLSEGSVGPGLGLLPTPLAGVLKLPTASQVLLVPGQCLSPLPFLPEVPFLPGQTSNLPESPVLQVTRNWVEYLMWEEGKKKRMLGDSKGQLILRGTKAGTSQRVRSFH